MPLVLGGVLISLLALALALYGIHRLTTLELARAARANGRSLLGVGAGDGAARATWLAWR